MSKKQLIIFCLLFHSFLSYGQMIKVSGLKTNYKKGEVIVFAVQNKYNSAILLSSFVLEKYSSVDKDWYEQVYDMLGNDCGVLSGKMGFTLKADSFKIIHWNPKKVKSTCFSYENNEGRYRLSFKYYTADIEDEGKYYYKEFDIVR